MNHDNDPQNVTQSTFTLAALVDDFVSADDFATHPAYVVRWTLRQFARNDFDTFDRSHRQQSIEPAPQLTGHKGWDGFFAALADYLAYRDSLIKPDWVDHPDRSNPGPVFYPGHSHRPPQIMAQLIEDQPAPWFAKRGVGIALSELPSGQGKHVPAAL